MATHRPEIHKASVRSEAEKTLGLIQRSVPFNPSWTGEVRKRYTDFLVYEIRKDGKVVHLQDFQEVEQVRPSPTTTTSPSKPIASPPKVENTPPTQPTSDSDRETLARLVGDSIANRLIALDQSVQSKEAVLSENKVTLDPVTERETRATIHQEIRRIFTGRMETVADSTGVITATPTRWAMSRGKGGNRGGRGDRGGRGGNYGGVNRQNTIRGREQTKSFGQLGGEYLHFTLYKENKDTMDAINTIARLLKIKASNFGFAGTKDRRAGTVQRVSVLRQRANNMTWLNTRLPNVRIGDFSHAKEPLQLGQHGGNEFIITVKNCRNLGDEGCSIQQRATLVQQSVEFALAYVQKHGYINYFGLQRFGTYSIGTHALGMKLLNGDYAGAVDDILFVNEHYLQDILDQTQTNNRDDFHRAKAISTWKLTKNADKALEILPKRFSSEGALIRHLGKNPKDFIGAILSITRGMRMMYIHAYQSYVWNYVATYRWSKYGEKVIEGDLVLVSHKSLARVSNDPDEMDTGFDMDEDNFYAEARPLTKDDVASGNFTIFDVVLPTPGYDVVYPQNDVGEYYASFMAKEENGALNPYEMRRKIKEFSLSGNYRPLIGRFIGEPQYAIRLYTDDMEQMYPTDLDICNHKKATEKAAKLALVTTTKSHWANFTENVAQIDNAVAADRRRKASEEPAQGDVVTNEIWVQTSLDGSAKRIKVTREKQVIEGQPTKPMEGIIPSVEVIEAPHSAPALSTTFLTPTQVSARPSPTAPSFASSSDLIVLEDVTPMAVDNQLIVPGEDVTGQPLRERSSAPALLDSSEAATPSTGFPGVIGQERGRLVNDPLVWFGLQDGTLPSAMRTPSSSTTESAGSVVNAEGEKPAIPDLVVPEFFSPSPNPILSLNGKIDETRPGADKIAVVLKFQLKSSNYATVVLRELMGANSGF